MHDPRLPRSLRIDEIYPGNGLPPRPGEDRPGLSPFGRLAMGGTPGGSSILIYDHRAQGVQPAETDMVVIQGDDLDASQLTVVLHPPRVVPLCFEDLSSILNQQSLTGEQDNCEVSQCEFPGSNEPIRWPPLEAIVEFGVGGVSTKAVVDYVNGVTFSVVASYLRVRAVVTQGKDCGEVFGTSALYRLAAHVGPGLCGTRAQRTIFVGEVDDCRDSEHVFDLPRQAKTAVLVGCRASHGKDPVVTKGWIRFWQDPKGCHCVGDGAQSLHGDRVTVPNAAQYFSVFNASGHKMKMSVVFELAL